ncbi:hypothetical protein V2J09_015759 [Rumex salicifolius]
MEDSMHAIELGGEIIETILTATGSTITNWINEISSAYSHINFIVVGLDIEWKPNRRRYEENRAATLQLCVGNKCLIVQLIHVDSIPRSLGDFLSSTRHIFVGVGVESDLAKLEEDYGLVCNSHRDVRRVALDTWQDGILSRCPGLKELADVVAGISVDKPKRVTMSNWEKWILADDQIRYACIDAYASFCIAILKLNGEYRVQGSTLFMTLNKIARADPIYGDVFLLENYAAFQTSLYELANLVPALAKLYQQASDAYEQACTRYVHMIIYNQFEQLFQYATKIEHLIVRNKPEEIRSMHGMSTTDLRRVLKITLSEIERFINAMYKALQRNLTLKELVRPLHIRFKKEFINKYQAVVELVGNIYPTESKLMPSVAEVRELLASIEEAYFL